MPAARASKVASPPSSPKTVTVTTPPAKALKEAAVAAAAKPAAKGKAKAAAAAKTETVVAAAPVEKPAKKAAAAKPAKKAAAAAKPTASEKPAKKEGEKTFTVSANDTTSRTGGRYISKTAKAAALKAARQLFIHESAANLKGKSSKINFTLKETTKGSSHNEHKYEALRVEKDTPTVIERNGVKIVYRYDYSVTSTA